MKIRLLVSWVLDTALCYLKCSALNLGRSGHLSFGTIAINFFHESDMVRICPSMYNSAGLNFRNSVSKQTVLCDIMRSLCVLLERFMYKLQR